jgi:hypothetical protein
MRIHRIASAAAMLAASAAAQATTVVVFVDPATFEKHTRIYNTPGADHLFMCIEPPATAGCTELPIKKRR